LPRQTNPQSEANFSGGLVTEASVFNFPENACTDADNVVFSIKGSVFRRYGLDYEDNYTTRSVSTTGNAMSSYTWINPAGADKTFFVIQIGRYLYFYNVGDAAVSQGAHATVIDLDSYKTSTANALAQNECQFASGQGYLFVVHPYCKPFYVQYTPSTDALTSSGIDVKVRDTEGIVDELGYNYDTRPTSLTDAHKYNLYNQGWSPTPTNYITSWRTNVDQTTYFYAGAPPVLIGNTVTISAGNSNYPSNSDVWWMCLNANRDFMPGLANSNKRGNTPAPKGYYVLDAWNMDRATASGISGITATTSGVERPSAIAFFAGRCFYAGVNAQGYSNKIFFTQVIKSTEQFGRCHQLNDPTNENLFDLLDTDGGFVTIPESGRVLKLFSIQSSLIVFATNGVWVITGNQGVGFSAGDYSVRRASAIPAISASSIVDVDGFPMWWNYDGIYAVTEVADTVYSGGVKIESLTQTTIRTFFKEDIPVTSKVYAHGAYNQLTKEVRWVYSSTDPTTVEGRYQFDRALTFSILNKSFYPWSFPSPDVKIHGVTALKTRGTTRQTVAGVRTNVTSMQGSVFKYIVSDGANLSFAETKNSGFLEFGETDFQSYLVTGYDLDKGDGKEAVIRKMQANYVTIYSRFEDVPQFYFQGIFDSGNSGNSGRWGTNQLVSFPPVGDYDYYKKKLKVRGSGHILQFKVSSVTGQPFDIAGWSCWRTNNASV
jgi:hypothetical protein